MFTNLQNPKKNPKKIPNHAENIPNFNLRLDVDGFSISKDICVRITVWIFPQLISTQNKKAFTLQQRVARLVGFSSRKFRISEAGINVKTSLIEAADSDQNWSQKWSSLASTAWNNNDKTTSKLILSAKFDSKSTSSGQSVVFSLLFE